MAWLEFPKRTPGVPKNVDIVETEFVTFRVVRSDHGIPNTKEEIGNAVAYCVEFTSAEFVEVSRRIGLKDALSGDFLNLRHSPQSSAIFKLPQVERIYITGAFDFSGRQLKLIKPVLKNRRNAILGILSTVAGLNFISDSKLALKITGAALLTSSVYLSKNEVYTQAIIKGFKGDFLSAFEKESLLFALSITNLIIAEKAATAARIESVAAGRKIEIAVAVGAAHGLITELLGASREERFSLLKQLLREAVDRRLLTEADVYPIEDSFYLIPFMHRETKEIDLVNTRDIK